MIGRIWKATATANGADVYRFHFEGRYFPA
jgi:hypothetical protein